MKNNAKHPVFFEGHISAQDIENGLVGLTKRELMAAMIMAKLVVNGSLKKDLIADAKVAVDAADVLLETLEKNK